MTEEAQRSALAELVSAITDAKLDKLVVNASMMVAKNVPASLPCACWDLDRT
jgi:hypothetical protein